MSARASRRIAAVSVAIGFACLIAQAIGVWVVHHGAMETAIGVVPPFLAVVCGLDYLRQSRRKS